MAITKDSGLRSNAAIDLADISEEDRALISRRRTAAGDLPGAEGVDIPVNSPHHNEPHVAPLWIMYATFAALIGLTVATVAARQVDLSFVSPSANIAVALGLALIKSLLVGLFFMHLWWDSKFNQVIIAGSVLFLIIFIGFAILDSNEYQPTVAPADPYNADLEPAL